MNRYHIIAESEESTVVAEYHVERSRSGDYQSESAMEQELIRQLCAQGYEHVEIRNERELIENLRRQLELLNQYTFSDGEWQRFFTENLANENESIVEKTRKIQSDYVQVLIRDDGSTKNIRLIEKKRIHDNRLQVLNQYTESGGAHESRYDVTILVNGLPLVHMELKRRGIDIREAFNQINRYQRESFWASSGLYEYIQIFVISNGTFTKYYSNTTRTQHIREAGGGGRPYVKKTSNSFEFTSYWADAENQVIADLTDFAKTFFAKHAILNILTKYCVFTTDNMLLVMRPYQIAATERILNRILVSSNYKRAGTLDAGGYIWHTTGSGKTLTSFKTAQLATNLAGIEKVLFVVDRKDLDYQTMKEYDNFEKGAANGNTSTKILQSQLEDPNCHIIITTIQKLNCFIGQNKAHDVYRRHVVLIFDECHRSQFGETHKRIVKAFKNYHIFGFTGTPIFAVNAMKGGDLQLKTTQQAFGDKLHTYTIVNAINDENVLPFLIDYVNTIKEPGEIKDKKVSAIDIENALMAPQRISGVTSYILDHFDQKTKRSSYYALKGKRLAGFNSIFAVASIPMAMKYYEEFRRQLQQQKKDLSIALIYCSSVNEEEAEGVVPDEDFEPEKLDQTSRDFLAGAIADYNAKFHVNFDVSSDKFENYYKDISARVKNREIDLLIVVNMFLTGFDATTLNTLWVDKNLRQHGLIQAFSRTNRILNSVKKCGNIICFRDLVDATQAAISLFGDKEATGIVLLRPYRDYYYGYEEDGKHREGYRELVETMVATYPLGHAIIGEAAQKEFVRLYSAILRLTNILTTFDEFAGNEILSERDFQDYQGEYLDIHQRLVKYRDVEKENIIDDIVFEIELIKQIEVNVDYILMLVNKYHDSNCVDKSILTSIDKAVGSSIELRSKKELIEGFISRINTDSRVEDDWQQFVTKQKEADLATIIEEEGLKPEKTQVFIANAFRDGFIRTVGTDLDEILPPVSRFSEHGGRAEKKQAVLERLLLFFEKYSGLI